MSTQLSDIHFNVILGGFGLFLLGIKFLGDGLKDAAGTKVRDYIEKYTGSLMSSIVVGTVITALMQSSTAATVISISLVRAGLMSLRQAIGISIGANLGTTVTALIIGLNVEELGFYFVFAGALILLFVSRKFYQSIGTIIFGFGITFVGLKIMGDQLSLLQQLPQFENFIRVTSENNWLALLAGTIATAVINSSTAVVAIVQQLYGNSEMTMAAASAFVFGSNIGTTLTAVLASFGGSVSTRRAGWFHAIYNILGALIMMLLIVPYSSFVVWLNGLLGGSPAMAVALNHFSFNLISTIAIIPFVPMFIRLLEWIIPGTDKIKSREKIAPLDYDLISRYPEGAMQLAQKTTTQMADLTLEALETTQDYLKSKDNEDFDVINQIEEMVDDLDHNLTRYLLEIVKHGDANLMAQDYTRNLEIVKSLERISDLSVDLADFYQLVFEHKEKFSEYAMTDLNELYQNVIEILKESFRMLNNYDASNYEELRENELAIAVKVEAYREKHFKRMADEICDTRVASSVFVDVLVKLERIVDHSIRVAKNVNASSKEVTLKAELGLAE